MTINSKQKGARGEREWAQFLNDNGFGKNKPAHRGQQYNGIEGDDVVCDDLPAIHFEVKRVNALRLEDAVKQSIRDADDKTPVVAYRRDRGEWLVIMRAKDWCDMVREGMA